MKRDPWIAAGLALALCACQGRSKHFLGSGVLEATEVTVAAPIAGRLLAAPAEEGETVAAGQMLAQIDSEPLKLQRQQTANRLAELAALSVSAQARCRQAEEEFSSVKTRYERMKKLYQAKSLAQQTYDDISTQHNVAKEGVITARQALSALEAQSKQAEAALALLDYQLSQSAVTAPIAGTLLSKLREAGEWANPGTSLSTLADLTRLYLKIYLPTEQMDLVRLGQTVKVLLDAAPDRPAIGKVSWIAAKSEFTPKNVQTRDSRAELVFAVKIDIANPEGRLKIGMPAEAWRE